MNNWEKLSGANLSALEQNRKYLHQAVQLVAAFPRNFLAHDPTDGTASLEWNTSSMGLESLPVETNKGNTIRVGLSYKTFALYVSAEEHMSTFFKLKGKSVLDGFDWLQSELQSHGFSSDKLNLKLPYEIESYDNSEALDVDLKVVNELASLFQNTQYMLQDIVVKRSNAYDIRCWPHHFDIATMLPLETDKDGELSKSVGVGLSPGDDSINEPYMYVNVWPQIDFSVLSKHELLIGHWNKSGWSGAVLTYSEMLDASDQERSITSFCNFVVDTLVKELNDSDLK